jgi:sporulation protein YlmC with PRC-barrel domain
LETYVILRRHAWPTPDALGESGKRSGEVAENEMPDDIYWLRSYALEEEDGTIGTVCIYKASSPEAIRDHADRVGMPVTEIIKVGDTIVVHPDE